MTLPAAVMRDTIAQPHPQQVMLLYVGADDCAPCRAWQRGPGATFHASSAAREHAAGLAYREVKSPTVLDLLDDRYWPEDLRPYRARLGRDAGVPLWLVIADGEVVARSFGAGQWEAAIVPRLKQLAR